MPRRRKKRLPAPRYPMTTEQQYRSDLKGLVRHLNKLCKQHLYPLFPDWVEVTQPLRFDADDNWMEQLQNALKKILTGMDEPNKRVQAVLDVHSQKVLKLSQKDWRRMIREAYGVAPQRYVEIEALEEQLKAYEELMDEWADYNANLITDISEFSIGQIAEEVIAALREGVTTEDLQDIVQERLGVADSRAELIARDQIGKLNGDLHRQQQEDAGVNSYVWRTVGDERVRDSHADCDGETFPWDGAVSIEGTPKPDGNDPGGDYQCRCYAEPILPSRMAFEMSLDTELDQAA